LDAAFEICRRGGKKKKKNNPMKRKELSAGGDVRGGSTLLSFHKHLNSRRGDKKAMRKTP